MKAAVKKYAHNLATGAINIGNAKQRKLLAKQLLEETAVSIQDVRNVWCHTASVANKFALLNIVETVSKN